MTESEEAVARLRVAFDLYDAGVAMMRCRYRREHPQATEAELNDLLQAWLLTRPGAEHGDGEGVPGTWPRSR